MGLTVNDVINVMESMAPSRLAEDWDNIGLQVGKGEWPVERVWVALDPTVEVMEAACRDNADLVITHHPLIFQPLTAIDFESPTGHVIRLSALNKTAVFTAHTNLDSAQNGLNDILAHRLELTNISALVSRDNPADKINRSVDNSAKILTGLGRIGELSQPITLGELASKIKPQFPAAVVRIVGAPHEPIKKVALCTGSGNSLIGPFLDSDADVYLSGDLSYHNGRLAESMGRFLIDIGHFASEYPIINDLAKRLRKVLGKANPGLTVVPCSLEQDPFVVI